MTTLLYQEWLLDWDQKLQGEGRKILLLQDNFSDHIIPNNLTNIQVKNFEPNLTAHIQPNNQGIISSFKAHYHAKFIQCAVDLYEVNVTPSNIYNINQLEVMWLAQDAWNNVDTTTIQNCWQKANILPDILSSPPLRPALPISSLFHPTDTANDQNNPAAHAEMLVEAALNNLNPTGVLWHSNWMDITELLNSTISVSKSGLGLPERLATELDHNQLGPDCGCQLLPLATSAVTGCQFCKCVWNQLQTSCDWSFSNRLRIE